MYVVIIHRGTNNLFRVNIINSDYFNKINKTSFFTWFRFATRLPHPFTNTVKSIQFYVFVSVWKFFDILLIKVICALNTWSESKDLNCVSLYIRQGTPHSISLWARYLKFLWIHALFFLCISLIIMRKKIKNNSYFSALTRNEENEKV